MKTIVFRLLRRIKKTGKITVASYPQWRKIKTADYNKFRLVVNVEYKSFPKDERVYNHKGEHLFWIHYNPEEIPMLNRHALVNGEQPPYPEMWKTDYSFSAKGLDCDGVPAFSHGTAESIYNNKSDMADFQPLTVEMVNYWFGWFLYRLENSETVYQD